MIEIEKIEYNGQDIVLVKHQEFKIRNGIKVIVWKGEWGGRLYYFFMESGWGKPIWVRN